MGNLQPKLMVMNVAIANISISAPKVAKQIASSNDMGTQTGVNNGVSGSSILDGLIDWIKSLTDLFTGHGSTNADTGNVASVGDKTQVSVALDYTEQLNQIINNTAVNDLDRINALASMHTIITPFVATICAAVVKMATTKNMPTGIEIGKATGTAQKGGGVMSKLGKVATTVGKGLMGHQLILALVLAAVGVVLAFGLAKLLKAWNKKSKENKENKQNKEKDAIQTANEMYKNLTVTGENVTITANQLELNSPQTPSDAIQKASEMYKNLDVTSDKVTITANQLEVNSPQTPSDATLTTNETYKNLDVTSDKVTITANQLEVNIPQVASNVLQQSGDNTVTDSTNLQNVSAVVINMCEANSKANSSNVSTTAYGSNYVVSDDNDIRNAYSIVSTDTKGNDVYNYNITNHNQFDMPITKDVDYDYIEKRVIETLTNGLLKEGSSTGTIELGEA